jgi:hypothetical protein
MPWCYKCINVVHVNEGFQIVAPQAKVFCPSLLFCSLGLCLVIHNTLLCVMTLYSGHSPIPRYATYSPAPSRITASTTPRSHSNYECSQRNTQPSFKRELSLPAALPPSNSTQDSLDSHTKLLYEPLSDSSQKILVCVKNFLDSKQAEYLVTPTLYQYAGVLTNDASF